MDARCARLRTVKVDLKSIEDILGQLGILSWRLETISGQLDRFGDDWGTI